MSLSQVMAPQMQQSLALLQAPTLELKALVEQELEQNPVLEEIAEAEMDQDEKDSPSDGEGEGEAPDSPDPTEPPADVNFDPATEKPNADPVDDFQVEFEKLTQMDQEWRDHFAQTNLPMRQSQEDEERRQFMFDSLVAGTSLQEVLLEQVRTTPMTEDQRSVAEMIVGNIDDYGYLQSSLDELAFSTNIGADKIEAVLKLVQGFHPPGVACRDLRECLMLQMERAGKNFTQEYRLVRDHFEALAKGHFSELARQVDMPVEKLREVSRRVDSFGHPGMPSPDVREGLLLELARGGKHYTLEYIIVRDHMDALGKRRLPEIARQLGLDVDDVQESVARIGSLEPRPGRDFLPDNQQYILPEVFVQKVGEDFVVTTNNDHVPHLRISNAYKDLMSQAESSTEVREYIREKIRAGKFLIKSLHQRQQTIMNIAKEIVNRQREFMEKGVAHLKPMTMVQVAEVVGVHETTVSRAVSGKYMQTPQGVVEMKYFFTSGVKTSSGVGMSNTSVKDLINEMVAKEDLFKPLSDEELVQMLAAKGVVIARRTIAKYRSELNILPSHLRKKY